MPFLQAAPAACRSSVLRNKDRMISKRRLFSIVGRVGRSQAFFYELFCMLQDGIEAPAAQVFQFCALQPEPTSKRRLCQVLEKSIQSIRRDVFHPDIIIVCVPPSNLSGTGRGLKS